MILNVKMLPDKSGRCLIHWLIEDVFDPSKVGPDSLDAVGRVVQQAACEGELFPIKIQGHTQLRTQMGQPVSIRARIACNPKQNTVNPQHKGQEVFMCMHSNDVRAATCPRCLATPEAVELMKSYENTEEIATSVAQ